ncbi:ABC transporter ATP-binding protein [Halobellus captivus]|uniref:ABC transporter ATP-binding protein n=1 Tax=Halobellus captivus TaxID=2592614 RepID=UPI0011A2416D|nr:ABC transporter ATP-binding protein [Halobellus captivus]
MKLTLENVRKEYGETVALGRRSDGESRTDGGVTFEVGDGEFFTLVGPSGCGKTTTLRLVAGFDSPSAGIIRFDGRDMRGVPPEDRGVGVVFQNYALFPHLSVAENVAYGLRFSDPPDGAIRDQRVASLLDLVDLSNAGDRDPTELSGGQQQRIALARALAPGPDLLLLDEPMSALDARLRERLRMQIKEIQSTLGITTVYVTHDQEEALAISDRVAVMNDGEVEQIGTPRAVYRHPESRFVAEFVGDNNVFEGTVLDVRPRNAENRTDAAAGSGESPVETKGFGGGSAEPDLAVDVGGVEIRVETSLDVSEGDRVVFCVRPEHMEVRRDENARSDGSNVLDATVVESEFLGDSTRVYLQWRDRELTVRSDDPLDGDVRIDFDAADAHVVERLKK